MRYLSNSRNIYEWVIYVIVNLYGVLIYLGKLILLASRKSNFGPLFGIFEKFDYSLVLSGFCGNPFVITPS